jgi:hypothetical protein
LIAPKADLLELARDPDHHMLPWQLTLLGLKDDAKK